jgi:hypothetical protein
VLTAACAIIALTLLGAAVLSGYVVGRARRIRNGQGYLAGRADGYQKGIHHGERARLALRRQVDELAADRDRLDAALDELGRRYDRLLAQQVAPRIARTVEDATGQAALVGDDTLAVFGGDDR